jgi:integrase/recombinase XerD
MAYTDYTNKVDFLETITATDQQLQYMLEIDDHYKFQIRAFAHWLKESDRGIDYSSIQDYFKALNKSTYAAGTINMKRQAVKKRIKQLSSAGRFDVDQAMKIDRALSQLDKDKETKARKINSSEITADKLITAAEYDKLLNGARSDRQRLFMRFLWHTGCRVKEMTSIRLEKVTLQGEYAKIRIMGKGSKERFVKITAALYRDIVSTFNSRTWLFGTSTDHEYSDGYITHQITKLGFAILNRRISSHTFRHSFATRKIAETNKIKAVSKYLGHSSVKTTMDLYVHEELSDDELFC